jgi:chromosome segregation ATPase
MDQLHARIQELEERDAAIELSLKNSHEFSQEVINQFGRIALDVASIKEAEESLRRMDKWKNDQADYAQNVLRALSREVNAIEAEISDEHSDDKAGQREDKRQQLEQAVMNDHKATNDVDKEIMELQEELEQLKMQEQALLSGDTSAFHETHEQVPTDTSVLKLSIYRALGIHLESDGSKFTSAILTNHEQNDVYNLPLDKYPHFFFVNHVWDKCS